MPWNLSAFVTVPALVVITATFLALSSGWDSPIPAISLVFSLPEPTLVKTDRISWLLYLVGSLLVFGSWVDIVPTGLGWIGWLMALVGWGIGSRQSRNDDGHTLLSRVEQIEKLGQLRKQTVITEEEFQREKRRLLDHPSDLQGAEVTDIVK